MSRLRTGFRRHHRRAGKVSIFKPLHGILRPVDDLSIVKRIERALKKKK